MTEQEAVALAARLTRVWKPYPRKPQWIFTDGFAFWCCIEGRDLSFIKGRKYQIQLFNVKDNTSPVHLYCNGDTGIIQLAHQGESRDRDFELSCLSFFRRNCWLSGAPIEASAHEKAESIQGFTREELEAWNLKM